MSLTKFNPRVGAETIKTVDSIADVKSSKDFSNPKLALGGVSPGDGLGGVYHWDIASQRTADDVNVIKSDSETIGRWIISTDTRVTGLIDALGNLSTRVLALEEADPAGPTGPTPTYNLSLLNQSTVTEGTTFTCRLEVTGVEYDTRLRYNITGSQIGRNPVLEALTDTFNVLTSINDFQFTVSNDVVTEVNETITVEIQTAIGESLPGPVVLEINVIDDSFYSLVKTTSGNIHQGDTFKIKLDVIEVPDGNIPFTITTLNNVSVTHSLPNSFFNVSNGVGQEIEFTVQSGSFPSGTTFTLSLDGLGISQTYPISYQTLSVSSAPNGDAATLSPTLGYGLLTVESNTSWIATANVDWVNFGVEGSSIEVTGNSSLGFLAEDNVTVSDRSGSITFTTTDGGATATWNFTQEASETALASNASFKLLIDTSLYAGDTFEILDADDILVNWGDGSAEQEIKSLTSDSVTSTTHEYTTDGIYTVYIKQTSGDHCRFAFNGLGKQFVKEVLRWGIMKRESLASFMNGCSNLTTLPTIPSSFDTSAVTNAHTAFASCSGLTSFPSGLDTSNVTNMTHTWGGCSGLTSFPSGLDTSNVTNMTRTWYYCRGLTSFPFIDTSSVTNMQSTWSQCNGLTSFPLIDTSSVTNMDSTWFACNGLTSFPLIDTSSVTNMQSAWRSCSGLTSFPLIDTSSVTDLYGTWYGCLVLGGEFPAIDTSNVTEMQLTWENCQSLQSFPTPTATWLNMNPNLTNLQSTWRNCRSLTSFPLIDTSNVNTLWFTWGECYNLTSFPSIDTSNVTNMQQAWYDCSGLTSFPSIDTSNVTNMIFTWAYCSGLTSFPSIDTSNVTDMSGAWSRCSSLTSFPSIDISSVTDIDTAWYNCSILADFTPFSNTTYTATSIRWRLCFYGTQITFSRADNPFLNLATGQDIPASTGDFSFVQPGNYTNYLPRYDISNAPQVTPLAETSTNYTAPEGSDIVGWNNITFTDVNNSGSPEIVMPTIPKADYNSIILQLYNNRSNHTPLTGGNHYEADFNGSVSSSAVATEKAALVSNGWIFTDGNP